jgi:hypothetical protein
MPLVVNKLDIRFLTRERQDILTVSNQEIQEVLYQAMMIYADRTTDKKRMKIALALAGSASTVRMYRKEVDDKA